ncbi:MAG: hypothetical protein M0T84_07110 [Betaproteobacteria bacterium]|nr:hypothetical protein [Betaproteobacteria bacterium]
MATKLPFTQLSESEQARARAMFVDARASDGYLYELGVDGKVLCRGRAKQERTEIANPPPTYEMNRRQGDSVSFGYGPSTNLERDSLEARAKRKQRIALHRSVDPLAKRLQSISYWRECKAANPISYREPLCSPLYRHPGFRDYLMPRTRATIEAKERAQREAYTARLREESVKWEAAKAARRAAKDAERRGQLSLF